VDSKGCVYVSGIGSVGMPTTNGFQTKPLAHTDNVKRPEGEYPGANGYVVKFFPDGSKILWASYVGSGISSRRSAEAGTWCWPSSFECRWTGPIATESIQALRPRCCP